MSHFIESEANYNFSTITKVIIKKKMMNKMLKISLGSIYKSSYHFA